MQVRLNILQLSPYSVKCCVSEDESIICSSAAKLLQFIEVEVRKYLELIVSFHCTLPIVRMFLVLTASFKNTYKIAIQYRLPTVNL